MHKKAVTEYYFPSQLICLSLVLLLNTVIVEVVVCGVCSSVVNGRSVICVAVTCVCVGVISVVVHIGIVAVIHVGVVTVIHVGVVTVVHVGVITVVHVGIVAVVHTGLVEVLILCAKKKDTPTKLQNNRTQTLMPVEGLCPLLIWLNAIPPKISGSIIQNPQTILKIINTCAAVFIITYLFFQ